MGLLGVDPTRRSIGFYRRRYPTIGSSSHPLQYTLRGEDSGTIEFRGSDRHKVNFTQKPQHCLIKATSGFISHPPTRGFLGYKASKDQTSFTANGDTSVYFRCAHSGYSIGDTAVNTT